MSTARVLVEFGAALKTERIKASYSVANFAKHTGGISKDDVRDFEAGKKVPDKLAIKKIVHCFPRLMAFEHELRHVVVSEKPEKPRKPRPAPKSETRLQIPQRQFRVQSSPRPSLVPRLEVVTQHTLPPVPLKHSPFVALKKTRSDVLAELTGMVKKRLGALEDETYDFTIKADAQGLVVKLRVEEKGMEDLVDSGCYVTVSGDRELAVFVKTKTSDICSVSMARVLGTLRLLEVAKLLHDTVKDRRYDS